MNSRRVLAVALAIGLMVEAIWLVMSPRSDWVLADNGFPDRTPPTPAAVVSDDDSHESAPIGSYIELVAPDFSGGWSTVQWQDVNGNWQNVDGWRGTLDDHGTRRWWVAAKDFGSGPFRWVVGEAASEPFNLPAGAGQTERVNLLASP